MAPRTFRTTPTLYKQCINSFLDGLKPEALIGRNYEQLPNNFKIIPPSQLTMRQLEFMPITLVADILLHVSICSTNTVVCTRKPL